MQSWFLAIRWKTESSVRDFFEDSVFPCYTGGDYYLQNDLQASIWSNRI